MSNKVLQDLNQERYDRLFFDDQSSGSHRSAQIVLPTLLDRQNVRSVLDVGCGTGGWLKACQDLGIRDVFGVDGAKAAQSEFLIDPSLFKRFDLSGNVDLGRTFDMVISLEVAEHIAPECAMEFVANLIRHAPLILFSAAVPYQGGTGHLNENWMGYWVSLFADKGYEPVDFLRSMHWDDARIEWWYRQNLIIFRDATKSEEIFPEIKASNPSTLVHPECLLTAVHRKSRLGASRTKDEDINYLRKLDQPAPGYGEEFDRPTASPYHGSLAQLLQDDTVEKGPLFLAASASIGRAKTAPPSLRSTSKSADFLVIGGPGVALQQVGTLINSHPGVFVPPTLSTGFFSRRAFASGSAWSELGQERKAAKLLRAYLDRRLTGSGKFNAEWVQVFARLMHPISDQSWYEAVFQAGCDYRALGEISTDYAMLPEQEIVECLNLNPNLRVFAIIDDPFEAALEYLRMILLEVPEVTGVLEELITSPAFLKRLDYQSWVDRWEKALPKNNFVQVPLGDDASSVLRATESILSSLDVHLLGEKNLPKNGPHLAALSRAKVPRHIQSALASALKESKFPPD